LHTRHIFWPVLEKKRTLQQRQRTKRPRLNPSNPAIRKEFQTSKYVNAKLGFPHSKRTTESLPQASWHFFPTIYGGLKVLPYKGTTTKVTKEYPNSPRTNLQVLNRKKKNKWAKKEKTRE
jgi:hypothetical protein